jgi:hypothetical protein
MKVKIEFDVSEEFVKSMMKKYGYERDEVVGIIMNLDQMFKKDGELLVEDYLNVFDV